MQASTNLVSDFDNCQNLVKKLQKNRENVPVELLKTKYANAYKKLLSDITASVKELLYQFFFSNLLLQKASTEELHDFLSKSQEIIDEEKGQLKQMSKVVLSEYDLTKAICIVEPVRNRIFQEAYAEKIWNGHCRKNDGRIINDLIDMVWDSEHEIWISQDGRSSMIMPPPAE